MIKQTFGNPCKQREHGFDVYKVHFNLYTCSFSHSNYLHTASPKGYIKKEACPHHNSQIWSRCAWSRPKLLIFGLVAAVVFSTCTFESTKDCTLPVEESP